jgi:hypothetical protein
MATAGDVAVVVVAVGVVHVARDDVAAAAGAGFVLTAALLVSTLFGLSVSTWSSFREPVSAVTCGQNLIKGPNKF